MDCYQSILSNTYKSLRVLFEKYQQIASISDEPEVAEVEMKSASNGSETATSGSSPGPAVRSFNPFKVITLSP